MMLVATALLIAAATEASVVPLARCLSVAEAPARLACLERETRLLVEAVGPGPVVAVSEPSRERPVSPPARIDALDSTVASAVSLGNDRWTVRLADGSRWQSEPWVVSRAPRQGTPATIRRNAVGSYMLKIPGERGVHVRQLIGP